jgi:hypothetical protein
MSDPSTAANSGSQQASSSVPPAIDVEALAQKVYQLMREEIRLSRARGDTRKTRK